MDITSLKVTSIFLSVDGEVNPKGQGAWSTFVRLAGCSAGCAFCDTKYSWKGGDIMSVDEVYDKILELGDGCKKVTITGGEPLQQQGMALDTLISRLLIDDYFITVETNGLFNVKPLLKRFPQISFIVDFKLPSAGKVAKKVEVDYYTDLPESCYLKFVISDALDFDIAMRAVKYLRGRTSAKIYFSPCSSSLKPSELFHLMKKERCFVLDIGFNLQMHKYIFLDDWRDEEC
jgi:7-carboxy-7-deazaguanine synthase